MSIGNFTGVMDTAIKGVEQRGFIMENEMCSYRIMARLLNKESKLK